MVEGVGIFAILLVFIQTGAVKCSVGKLKYPSINKTIENLT